MLTLNACYDFGVQPISLGDLLLFHAAAEMTRRSNGFDRLSFYLLYDYEKRGMADPVFGDITQDNIPYTLMPMLEVLYLSKRVSSVHIIDSYARWERHERTLGEGDIFWPPRPIRDNYYYYWILNELIPAYAKGAPLGPLFEWREALLSWCRRFFQTWVFPRIPICVQLRMNPGIDVARNAQVGEWCAFFREAVERYPVSFVIIGAKHEMSEEIATIPHVIYAKAHGSTIGQDLALIKSSLFFMGSPSGPAVLPIVDGESFCCLGQKVVVDQSVPQLRLPLVPVPGAGGIRFAFNTDCQTLVEARETQDIIWRVFDRLYWRHAERADTYYHDVWGMP